jgi:photosystem II stability/assembly factor-like uncharacterized protein
MRPRYINAVAQLASRLSPPIAATAAIALLAGCMATESGVGKIRNDEPSDPVVRMTMGVAGVGALGKTSVITLDRLEIVMISGSGDTLRDTITSSTTPALNPLSSSPQTIAKNFELKALRSWKILATTRDVSDSIVHRDSVELPVLYAGDTALVSLNLSSLYARYLATFLSLPDSVSSSNPSDPKQALFINRLVLSIDGVVVRDSSATPGPYFAAGAPHVLDFDYIAAGTGTWRALSSGTGKNLHAVDFGSRDTGYIAGDTVLLKTVDGGATWSSLSAPPRSMRYVSFINGGRGLIGGDSATRGYTTDGGATWNYKKLSAFTSVVSPVALVSDTGFAMTNATTPTGSSTYYRLIDTAFSIRSGYANNIFGLTCPTSSACWAVGHLGTIRKDVNASGTFTTLQTSGTTKALHGVHFLDALQGWSVGDTGTILKTVNGGTTWSAQTSGSTQNLRAVYFIDSAIGYAVGFNGTILATINGGTTWAPQISGTTNHLTGLSFSGARGYAVGAGGTILTLNDVRQVEMRAYGPMGSWNISNPLFVGTRYVNVSAGLDATVALVLRWAGPTTGTGRLNATVGKTGTVLVDGEFDDSVIP